MGYGDDLGLINAILIHQTNRQKILGSGLLPHLNELFWYAQYQEKHNPLGETRFITSVAYILGKARIKAAQTKIAQLSSKIEGMTLLEKQALLVEAFQELELAEGLLK